MIFSLICVTNNQEIVSKMIDSLKKQNFNNYELIIIDTTINHYESAVDALNDGAAKATGKYLVFLHHDILFIDNDVLFKLYNLLENEYNLGIAGAAGAPLNGGKTIGNLLHGIKKERICDILIDKPVSVQSVDECFFIIPRYVYQKYSMDNNNKTWHLYSVEYSLSVKEQGYNVKVLPLNVYHASKGNSINLSFYKELFRLAKIYKKKLKNINTPMGYWSTNYYKIRYQATKHYIKCLFLIKFNSK